MIRRAAGAEGRALVRLLLALQDQPGDALRRLLGRDMGDAETAIGVELGIGPRSDQPLSGISPIPRHFRGTTSKTSFRISSAARLPSLRTARAYWFSTSARPASSCSTHINTPWRMSSGSKPVTTMGTWYFSGNRFVLRGAHDRADVAGGQEALHAVGGRTEHGTHCRRHQHVRDQHGEVRQSQPRACTTAMALAGAVVSKPTAKNTTCLPGFFWAKATASMASRRSARRPLPTSP